MLLEAVIERAASTANHADTGHLVDDVLTQLKAVIALLTPHQTSATTGLIALITPRRRPRRRFPLREQPMIPNIGLFDDRMRLAKSRENSPGAPT